MTELSWMCQKTLKGLVAETLLRSKKAYDEAENRKKVEADLEATIQSIIKDKHKIEISEGNRNYCRNALTNVIPR